MPYLELRRGRWHYHYVLVIAHRGQRIRKEIRCLSEFPDSEDKSQAAVYLHREETRNQIIEGIDRGDASVLAAGRPTFHQLGDRWLGDAKAREIVLHTAGPMVRILQDKMPQGPAADILPEQIRSVRDQLKDERELGPRAVNHYMALAHGVYQLAIDDGILKDDSGRHIPNPVAAVKRLREPKRTPIRFTIRQLQALLMALDDYETMDGNTRTADVPMRGLVLTALNSGLRPSITARVRWEWWNPERGLLAIPADYMKADADHVVIIWPALDAYLRELHMAFGRPGNGWIYPNPRTGEPFKDFRIQWYRLRDLANTKLEEWANGTDAELITDRVQFRHLRHTVASELLESGLPLSAVADTLGNTEATARRHYAEIQVEKRRRLMKTALEDHPQLSALLGMV